MQWIFGIRNSGLQRSFYLWNWTRLGWIWGRGHLSSGNQILFLNSYFTLDALQVNCSMPREVWGGRLTFTGSLIDYPICAILLLTLVIKKHPRWNLSSPDKACRIAFCKAKMRGSWMRGFCLEIPGTWPWHTLVQLHLASDCHSLSPKQHLTPWVCMQNPAAPQSMKYSRFCLCRPWTVLLPAGVVIELAVLSCPDAKVGTPPSPMIKYGGCSEITPVIVPVW